jgi:PHD/YefM family antitoxin component YafN of YafNO toxin-antitoxin module
MPQIIPIRDLKNTAAVSEKCKNSNEPIFITKNGYGDMVLMSMALYEESMAKLNVAKLVNESLDDIKDGKKPLEGKKFFEKMKKRYE